MPFFDPDLLFAPRRVCGAGFARLPTIVERELVATSHPLATHAGVKALEAGGNAIDAAVSAASVLAVAEPTDSGLGGDAFALVWYGGKLFGVNGSGRAPADISQSVVHTTGPRSVTVPGAVALWGSLADRFGRLGLDRCLMPAIDLASRGPIATARVADLWKRAVREGRAPWPAPRAGQRYEIPDLALALRAVAADGADGFYQGWIAEAIADSTWLSAEDLANHDTEWVEPLRLAYRGVDVCELPPNGQGAAALIALSLASEVKTQDAVDRLHLQIEAMKLAFTDAYQYVGDAPLPPWLLDESHLASRRRLIRHDSALEAEPSRAPASNTAYLCCVDEDRNAVSLIQSLYDRFGSGVVAAHTGIVLQNRACGFVETEGHPNQLAPRKRPFHTIIPGMLVQGEELVGPFGVMGGSMQPQGHLQVIQHLLDSGVDPQSALDAGRFKVEEGRRVLIEPGLRNLAAGLASRGHDVRVADNPHPFGVGQVILNGGSYLVGGSDGRADGHAAGS